MKTITTYNSSRNRLGDKSLYTNINTRNNGTYMNRQDGLYNSNLGELQQTRYFSGVDAEIYFGEVYIDEAVNINFSLQQNTMPIFGYNSYIFDTCAQGSRLIQGSFTVNFTKSNYLYEVMNTLSIVNSGAKLSSINHACNNYSVNKKHPSAMWDKCFDIVLSYGNCYVANGGPTSERVNLSTMVMLRGVYIIGCEQDFGTGQAGGKGASTGGIPLYETYYFYARDIEYDTTIPSKSEVDTDNNIHPIIDNYIDNIDVWFEYDNSVNKYRLFCSFDHSPDINIPIDNGINNVEVIINNNHLVPLQINTVVDKDESSIFVNEIASSIIQSNKLDNYLRSNQNYEIQLKSITIYYYSIDGILNSYTTSRNITVPVVL